MKEAKLLLGIHDVHIALVLEVLSESSSDGGILHRIAFNQAMRRLLTKSNIPVAQEVFYFIIYDITSNQAYVCN